MGRVGGGELWERQTEAGPPFPYRYRTLHMTLLDYPRWRPTGAGSFPEGDRVRQALTTDVEEWFDMVRQFRGLETDELIVRDPSPVSLRLHRTALTQLIARGEELSIELLVSALSNATVEAELKCLYDSLYSWHAHSLSHPRKTELMHEVFGGA